MKKTLKYFTLILAAVFILPLIAACSTGGGGKEKKDDKRTQLYVFRYNGGVDGAWLVEAKKRFEEKFANVSFESGKMGVQILPDEKKTNGKDMFDSISTNPNEVIINEFINYNEWVAHNKLLDISDVVTSINSDNKTIKSKLSEEQQKNLTHRDGTYYALPYYEAFRGVVYDIDLFEEEKLYFKDGGGFIERISDKKSAGPDGIYNTSDDGLPATFEQFFELCNYMLNDKEDLQPFVWSGKNYEYLVFILSQIHDNIAGKNEAMLNYNFGHEIPEGQNLAKIVTGFQGDNPIVALKEITEKNGYELFQSEARYRAVEFLLKILNTPDYYYSDSINNSTFDNLAAQDYYVYSKFDLNKKRVAMLVEGTWWETEASRVGGPFEDSYEEFGDRAKNRNFGWMPLPVAVSGTVNAENGKKQVLNNYMNTHVGINATTAEWKIDLAKEFVKFLYTDEVLNVFTAKTGMSIGVDYVMTEETFSQVSKFSKNLLNLRNESEVITMQSTAPLFISKENDFIDYSAIWNSRVGTMDYRYPVDAFKDFRASSRVLSAKSYFSGMSKTKESWESKYQQYWSTN